MFTRITSEQPNKQMPGYWTKDNEENVKNSFLEYAEAHHFDPLVAQNWYSISGRAFIDYKVYFVY